MSRNKREGRYAGKFKECYGYLQYGRVKHWRTEHFSVSLKAYGKRSKKLMVENMLLALQYSQSRVE